MDEPIILRRNRMLAVWGLKQMPPFADVPPKDDSQRLARLFTGRRQELNRVLLPLWDGHNILVRGAWGVGKTTFILQTLHELARQASLVKEKLLPIYIDNFRGGTADEFYRIVLKALAKALAGKDVAARKVADALRGVHVSHSSTKSVSGKAELQLWTVLSVSAEAGKQTGSETVMSVENAEYWTEELLRRACARFQHVVIAMDDLDKTDPRPDSYVQIRAMLDGALPLLRSEKCAFILTGRTLTVAQDIYGAILGIFDEQLQLAPLKAEELHEIAIKTLNLVRKEERQDTQPFSNAAIAEIADKSYGIPRVFNQICRDVLEIAILRGYQTLDADSFNRCFAEVQATLSANLDAQARHLLYIAQKHGGISQDNRKALQELGWGDFVEVLPVLDQMVQRDIMIRQDYAGGIRFIISARAQKAAQEPPPQT